MAENTVNGKAVTKQEQTKITGTRAPDRFLIPAVDIYENEEALTLLADVPGVRKEDLDIQVEQSVLTIHAKPTHAPRQGAIWEEFALMDYFRQFNLADEIDAEKISARLERGVLTLILPKAEQSRPRKIEVTIS